MFTKVEVFKNLKEKIQHHRPMFERNHRNAYSEFTSALSCGELKQVPEVTEETIDSNDLDDSD